jgi:hypothetical protein
MTCQNKGPWFSNINEEACKVYDGVWCRNPRNCNVLNDCIKNLEFSSPMGSENKTSAFELYVRASPKIRNIDNPTQCGKLREYFGFDFDYLEDQDICDELERLKSDPDFSDLDGLNVLNTGEDDTVDGEIRIANAKTTTKSKFFLLAVLRVPH